MENGIKKILLQPYVMLMLVAIVMSFAIAGVYSVTKDTIEAAALEAQAAARLAVMPEADVMTEIYPEDGAPVDYCYEAYDANGEFIGLVSQITVVGFGGEIEVTVGMDTTGAITAISVGGSDFSETSGLGAKTREPAFTDQFKGMSGMLVLKQNIDSVTGASISSGAVVSGVNKALDYMKSVLPEGTLSTVTEELSLTEEQIAEVLPGAQNVVWMGGGSGVDGWWQADNGYIVRATGFGEGPITVTMGFDTNGAVTGIIIGDENFMETEGRGDRVREDWYKEQFIGRSGEQAYGDELDAISGATVTSDATLSAINACMTFDPAAPGTAQPAATPAPDAATEASVTEEETSSAEASAEADAATEASVVEEEPAAAAVTPDREPPVAQEADAATEASIPEEEAVAVTPTPAPTQVPDAVTEAPIPEEGTEAVVVTPTPAPTPTPDAETGASIPEEEAEAVVVTPTPAPTPTPDAVTEASVTEEEEEPATASIRVSFIPLPVRTQEADAVTEASVTE